MCACAVHVCAVHARACVCAVCVHVCSACVYVCVCAVHVFVCFCILNRSRMSVSVLLFCFYHDLDCLKIMDKNSIWREKRDKESKERGCKLVASSFHTKP